MARRAALVVALMASLVPGRTGAEPPRSLDELRARIARVLLREQVPGVGVALVEGDRVVWAGGVGVADRATGRPVTADTLFRVGSITKSFVALALVKLHEQGRVDLSARIRDLAPELAIENRWDADQPITLAHILEHTAGFDDMHPNETYGPPGAETMPLGDVLAINPRSRVARWRPGSRFSYANPGYVVAGYVLEKVTGRPWPDVLRDEIFSPLGMTDVALRLTPEVESRLARGYEGGPDPVPYRAIYGGPAGALMTSPRQLAALVKLWLARGRVGDRQLVSRAGIARTERSETRRLRGSDADYGLANQGVVLERARLRGHGGGIDGFVSFCGYLPDHDVGFVMLMNDTHSPAAFAAIAGLIIDYLLGDTAPTPPPRVPVPEEELRRWVGSYHFASPRHQLFAFLERTGPGVELVVEGGRLFAQELPGARRVELIPLGGGRFRVPAASGSHVILGHDAEGRRALSLAVGYLVEEPRWRTLGCYWGARAVVWILLATLLLPLSAFGRRPGPSTVWPVTATVSFLAAPQLFVAAAQARVLGGLNVYTAGVFLATCTFAFASIAGAVQAVAWLDRPILAAVKVHRILLALAGCAATIYLAGYGIIGIRLWSY